MEELDSKQVREAIKYLVELGGVSIVRDDDTIVFVGDETNPMTIKTADDSDAIVKILSGNMRTPEFGVTEIILNPFKETVRVPMVLIKFYRNMELVLSKMIHRIIQRSLEVSIIDDTSALTNDELAFIGKFKINKGMLDEFNRVDFKDMLAIRYDRKEQCTVVASKFLNDLELMNIRKGSVTVFAQMFNAIFEDHLLDEFATKATSMSCRQCSAILGTILKIYDVANENIFTMLGQKIDTTGLSSIISNLTEYSKFTSWVMTSTVTVPDEKANETVTRTPSFETPAPTQTNVVDIGRVSFEPPSGATLAHNPNDTTVPDPTKVIGNFAVPVVNQQQNLPMNNGMYSPGFQQVNPNQQMAMAW